jgi:putative hydrolase of the HAD superfamily
MKPIILLDWGDTLMQVFPEQQGPMAEWPEVAAIEGAAETLAALSKKSLLYIATNAGESSDEDIARALARVALDHHIDGIFCRSNLGYQKPQAEFYLGICDRLHCDTSDVAMVGDSLENDILPARNLGMDAYWLNSDTNTQAAPEGAVLIRSLSELLSH